MGSQSTKENKNIYQTSRENVHLTRDAASERLSFISPDRIEKIENEKTLPYPDEILAMAEAYKNPLYATIIALTHAQLGKSMFRNYS